MNWFDSVPGFLPGNMEFPDLKRPGHQAIEAKEVEPALYIVFPERSIIKISCRNG